MNNMNESTSLLGRIKEKAVGLVADSLIYQAELGTKSSLVAFISEPKIPVELMTGDDD